LQINIPPTLGSIWMDGPVRSCLYVTSPLNCIIWAHQPLTDFSFTDTPIQKVPVYKAHISVHISGQKHCSWDCLKIEKFFHALALQSSFVLFPLLLRRKWVIRLYLGSFLTFCHFQASAPQRVLQP